MKKRRVLFLLITAVLVPAGLHATPFNYSADINNDKKIDMLDLAELVANWLTEAPQFDPNYMIQIPAGQFDMGDHYDEGGYDELPVHTVSLESFYISKFEITNQLYCDYLNSAILLGLIEVRSGIVYTAGGGTDPYFDTHSSDSNSQIDYNGGVFSVRIKDGNDMSNHPVVQVSWYGAVAYCNWRSLMEGYEQCYYLATWDHDFNLNGYHLPTEAEWEYAARGGQYSPYYRYPWYPWGNIIDGPMANFSGSGDPYENGTYPHTTPAGFYDGTQMPPYGMDRANGYGLYDMAGNVWEWCNDWYGSDYYSNSPSNNPEGPVIATTRVLRGGGWNVANLLEFRVSERDSGGPSGRWAGVGFRVVLGGTTE